MSQAPIESWAAQVQDLARAFAYPATPDIASAVEQRLAARPKPMRLLLARQQLVWVALLILAVLVGMLAVPQVRAAVVEFLQLGAIRIFLTEPTPTATLALPTVPAQDTGSTRATTTPRPTPTPLTSRLNLAGETTLSQAEAQAGFSIRRPTYPADLGPPERVFFQELGGPVVVLVWLAPNNPEKVRLSLHQLGPGTFAQKGQPRLIQETTVKGQPALWTEGPYVLQFLKNNQPIFDLRQLVKGHVLIWVEGEITYRLETDLPLEEAIKIAESLE
jgi:hypothetical protein